MFVDKPLALPRFKIPEISADSKPKVILNISFYKKHYAGNTICDNDVLNVINVNTSA